MKMEKDYCKYFETAEKIRGDLDLDKEMNSLREALRSYEEVSDFIFLAIMAFLLETGDEVLTASLLKKLTHIAQECFGETQSYCTDCTRCKESFGHYICEVTMRRINKDDAVGGCLSFEHINNPHDMEEEE